MALDRTGEPVPDPCRHPDCRRGWLTGPYADEPVPCPYCKPHLSSKTPDINDYAERTPSARAQQAIDREDAQ